jgi:hypothetical protein
MISALLALDSQTFEDCMLEHSLQVSKHELRRAGRIIASVEVSVLDRTAKDILVIQIGSGSKYKSLCWP